MYEKWKDTDNFYENVPASHFVACPEDIWQPVHHGEDEWGEQEVKGNTRLQEFLEDLSRRLVDILDHKFCVFCVTMMTVWALFMDDLIVGVPMSREVDYACAWTTLIFLLLFLIEQALRSWAQYAPRTQPHVSPRLPPLTRPSCCTCRPHASRLAGAKSTF